MKNSIIAVMVIFIGMVVFDACYYDNPPEPVPIDPELVSYGTHIQPILTKSCATSFCHDGTKVPDLRPENAYTNLLSGGYVNLTFPADSKLYRLVDWQVNPMPPDVKLTELDRQLILIWLEKGAPNN